MTIIIRRRSRKQKGKVERMALSQYLGRFFLQFSHQRSPQVRNGFKAEIVASKITKIRKVRIENGVSGGQNSGVV